MYDLNREDNFFLTLISIKYLVIKAKIKYQLNLNELSKPSWIEVSRRDFDLLIKCVADNLDNKNYKTINGVDYDLKKAKEF